MPKPSEVTQYKIRIREDLRRRLEQEAKRHGRSINSEIASRLSDSLDLPKLSKITTDLENVYARFARETGDSLATQELMDAAENLVKRLPAAEVRELGPAIAWVQKSIAAIAARHGRTYHHEPWEK
jgi:Arc-like DNA binding domain